MRYKEMRINRNEIKSQDLDKKMGHVSLRLFS